MKQSKNRPAILANWQVKTVSFILAVLTVFIVYYSGQQTRKVTLPLKVEMPVGYTAVSNIPTEAELVIKGSEKQIYMFNPADFSLRADFSKVNANGVSSAEIKIEHSDFSQELDLADITFYASPAWIRIYFENN